MDFHGWISVHVDYTKGCEMFRNNDLHLVSILESTLITVLFRSHLVAVLFGIAQGGGYDHVPQRWIGKTL